MDTRDNRMLGTFAGMERAALPLSIVNDVSSAPPCSFFCARSVAECYGAGFCFLLVFLLAAHTTCRNAVSYAILFVRDVAYFGTDVVGILPIGGKTA
jgi:hypothetical protein